MLKTKFYALLPIFFICLQKGTYKIEQLTRKITVYKLTEVFSIYYTQHVQEFCIIFLFSNTSSSFIFMFVFIVIELSEELLRCPITLVAAFLLFMFQKNTKKNRVSHFNMSSHINSIDKAIRIRNKTCVYGLAQFFYVSV